MERNEKSMTDKEAIEHLIFRYGHVIDDQQWDRLGEIFADTGSFEIENTEISVEGLARIVEFMSSIKHPLAHYSTNVLIEIEEGADVANAKVKLFAPRADGTVAIATYNDDIVRTEAGWRFQRRFVKVTDLRWRSAAAVEA
jgi:3-phenylpropionate/cinnamic acid dioxygenase small subunit